jgi:hypothetical protein
VVLAPLALNSAPAGFNPAPQPPPARPAALDVMVFDPLTAVAVRPYMNCTYGFSITVDGGAHWTPFRAPVPLIPQGPGNDTNCPTVGVPYYVPEPNIFYLDINRQRQVSVDAGLTWRPFDDTALPARELPATVPVRRLDDTGWRIPSAGPSTLDDSGNPVRMLTPPGVRVANQVRVSPDGVIWAASPDPAGPVTMSVTTDRGRNWRTAPLPDSSVAAIFPRGGLEAYALATWFDPEAPADRHRERVMVWHTTDGSTWDKREAVALRGVLDATSPGAILTLDGALVVAIWGSSGAWISRDGGATFVPGPPLPGGPITNSGSRSDLLWARGSDESLHVTRDGRSWTSISLPD